MLRGVVGVVVGVTLLVAALVALIRGLSPGGKLPAGEGAHRHGREAPTHGPER